MAMTGASMNPVEPNKVSNVAKVMATTPVNDPLAGLADAFEADVKEEVVAAATTYKAAKAQGELGTNLSDLCEDDAYNLEVAIAASAMSSPDFLKLNLKDPNYVPRWGNTNVMRQGQLRAKGFSYVSREDLKNSEDYESQVDASGHIVWNDLVALKINKGIYFSGLRRAYVKSLHATNNKKAAEAGAAHAKANLVGALKGGERAYLENQVEQTGKEIYNPNVGV